MKVRIDTDCAFCGHGNSFIISAGHELIFGDAPDYDEEIVQSYQCGRCYSFYYEVRNPVGCIVIIEEE
jgi:hypothetical protein